MRRKDGKPRAFRAGKRKCGRCKAVWNRVKGDRKALCIRCRERCGRCDVVLTEYDKELGIRNRNYSCRACVIELAKISQAKNDPKGERRRDWRLVNDYGITSVEYNTILNAQNGGCWICGKVPSKGQRRLSVDHLHSKGENKRNPREKRGRVRGLLCWGCNAALGKFGDNITKLRKAATYLEQWPAQQHLKEKE